MDGSGQPEKRDSKDAGPETAPAVAPRAPEVGAGVALLLVLGGIGVRSADLIGAAGRRSATAFFGGHRADHAAMVARKLASRFVRAFAPTILGGASPCAARWECHDRSVERVQVLNPSIERPSTT